MKHGFESFRIHNLKIRLKGVGVIRWLRNDHTTIANSMKRVKDLISSGWGYQSMVKNRRFDASQRLLDWSAILDRSTKIGFVILSNSRLLDWWPPSQLVEVESSSRMLVIRRMAAQKEICKHVQIGPCRNPSHRTTVGMLQQFHLIPDYSTKKS